MTENQKKRLKLRKKTPKPSKALERLKINQGKGRTPDDFKKDLVGTVEARRKSEVKQKVAAEKAETALARSGREQMSTKYYDENGDIITQDRMRVLQDTVASFYENFVVLTDEQIKELQYKLPKQINNSNVKVGHKAVFPPVLDTERKKMSRGRIIQKANRLRYIESETTRGLKMPEDLESLLSDSKKSAQYIKSKQAKKDLVRTLVALNYSDFEMCEYLEITVNELARLKKEVFFEELAMHRSMNNEDLFVQYKLQQMEVIKDLDVIIERFKGSKQLTALAAALRTKSDIYNEIINKGYEFGVIDKTPDKQAVLVGNIDISSASLDDLRSQLSKTQSEIQSVMESDNFLKEEDTIDVEAS